MKDTLSAILTDVSVREGSQQKVDLLGLSVADKLSIAVQSARIGVTCHELTAFAPGSWFGDAEQIATSAGELLDENQTLRALYFNVRGLDTLIKFPRFHAEGIFHTAVTKGYREKNYRQFSSEEIDAKLVSLLTQFKANILSFDTLVLSTVWGELSEETSSEQVVKIIEGIYSRAVNEGLPLRSVTLCDTEGQADPNEIEATVKAVKRTWPEMIIRMHLHPARDTALECIHAAIDAGAGEWEASWGGMGGSPLADKAGGNLDIRHLIKVWEERKLNHGLNLTEVDKMIALLRSKISRTVIDI